MNTHQEYRAYRDKISAALRLLKQSRKISWYEFDRETSSRIVVFYHITVPSLGREILVKFTLGSNDDDNQSTNFVPIELSKYPQIVSVEEVRDIILRAISTREKGIFHEIVIGQALEILKEQGIIHGYAEAIDRDDMRGVDFMVYFFNAQGVYMEMPLQVKSSTAGQRNHAKVFPDIPSICIARANVEGKEAALQNLERIIFAYMQHQEEVLHL